VFITRKANVDLKKLVMNGMEVFRNRALSFAFRANINAIKSQLTSGFYVEIGMQGVRHGKDRDCRDSERDRAAAGG
jgi:hypothetical protein